MDNEKEILTEETETETPVEVETENNNGKKFDKKKYIILIALIVLMVIATIAVTSYAFFTISNKEGSENVITSGQMKLSLTDGPQITAARMIPGDTVSKTFKVKNTGNINTKYDIYLSEVINTFVDQSDLVYSITSNDGGYSTSTDVQVPNAPAKIVNQQEIAPNEEHNYTLTIKFLNKDENQDDNQGAEFSAKININDYSFSVAPASSVQYDNTNSGLNANNVQDALDAINTMLD